MKRKSKDENRPIVYDEIVGMLANTIIVKKTFLERAERYRNQALKEVRDAEKRLKRYQKTGILEDILEVKS